MLGVKATTETFNMSALIVGMNALSPVEAETHVVGALVAGQYEDGDIQIVVVVEQNQTEKRVVVPFKMALTVLREFEVVGENVV